MYASTDPNTIAAAEQHMSAITECMKLAPDNGHLINDYFIEQTLLAVARGQWSEDDERNLRERHIAGLDVELPAPRVLVIEDRPAFELLRDGYSTDDEVANWFVRDNARPASERPTERRSPCRRCWNPLDETASAPALNCLWLAAPPKIVEFAFCDRCRDDLDARFGQIVWKY